MQINSVSGNGIDSVSLQKMMAEMKERCFKKLDADGDGGIDASELTDLAKTTDKSADEIISAYDKNQDGALNADEMDAMMREMKPRFSFGDGEGMQRGGEPGDMAAMKAQWFEKLDANNNGGIDASELTDLAKSTDQTADEVLSKYDTNQDGVLNADEMDAMMRELRPRFGSEGTGNEEGYDQNSNTLLANSLTSSTFVIQA
jgi:Ca2+-binding EF-hand superfamily protein